MTDADPGPPEHESDSDPERSWAYKNLSRTDKIGFFVAAVLVTLVGLGVAFLIFVVVRAIATTLLGA